jgi:hypothetical protein
MSAKNLGRASIIVVIILILVQFVPVSKTNPPITGDIVCPAEVHAVLKRCCYDCHSNETVWPWYSKLAPVSWLLASDVSEARDRMNFSEWQGRTKEGQDFLKEQIVKETEKGEMPPFIYTLGHPKSKLSDDEKKLLKTWVFGQ